MTLLDKTNTLVIVPAYNEQDSIVSVIEEIKATGFPFVVIDDGSTDETRNRAVTAGARTISLPFNAGVGGALKCGFRFAVKENFLAIVQIDADGQHPIAGIPLLVEAANLNGSHMIIGSRFKSGETNQTMNFVRINGVRFLSLLMRVLFRADVSDPTSGNRIIQKELLVEYAKNFPRQYLGDTFEATVIALRKGFVITEIPAPFTNRITGTPSKKSVTASGFYLRAVIKAVLLKI